MLNNLKRQWASLRRSRPGHRFQDRYERNRQTKKNHSIVGRVVRIVVAVAAFVVGVVLVFIPGPAILFFAIAGALLAAESRWVARGLDWLEVQCRRVWNWSKRHWRRLHAAGKVAVVSGAAVAGGAVAYASYYVLVIR